MNLPPNLSVEMKAYFLEVKEKITFIEKTCRAKIFSSQGGLIWEESQEDYQARMNELFYEVK